MKKLIFDVGASAIKYALMDNDAHIYEKGKEVTPHDNFEHFLTILKSIYEKYQTQIDGIALSLPGTIDSVRGQIYAPGGLSYNENINLVDKMRSFTQLPITIENLEMSTVGRGIWQEN